MEIKIKRDESAVTAFLIGRLDTPASQEVAPEFEELKADVDQDKKAITFETKHLSYFGVYATGEDNLVLNVKDGKVVKNYRLDDSPDTGDKSFSIYYVYAILLLSLGLILILAKKREVKA